jgi:1-pyrroline-5-carboxylate dehydrogenase
MLRAMSRIPPPPLNEPVLSYAPRSPERFALSAELLRQKGDVVDIPMIIDGKEVRTGSLLEARSPHEHQRVLGRAHQGGAEEVQAAIGAALRARAGWAALPASERAAIFLRAAEALATRDRARINAATMLGQSKTAYQAEIDAACELVDFLRFNAHWAARLLEQPAQAPGIWNHVEPRPLEGFVAAITPFNFTAIAGNLPTAPAMLGNVVVWKPSPNALLAAHHVMSILREAGLPDGVINLVMGDAPSMVGQLVDHPQLAGVHFTGSTAVFRSIWKRVGERIDGYRSFPRLVGETGGKDFVFAHASAELDALATALVRGAFEFQGQKCSAASRAYVPRSIWPALRERLVDTVRSITMGDVSDFSSFMGAVIDQRAYARLRAVQEEAKHDAKYRLVCGGGGSDEVGYFIEPTIVESLSPATRLMSEEFFGPVLGVFVYDDAEVESALELCDQTGGYALTGAVFARDRHFVEHASQRLADAAGNFYINDKPTGAVVGQQPFGGGRASGTNDKAGSPLNLLRWASPRAVKENLCPPTSIGYPSIEPD